MATPSYTILNSGGQIRSSGTANTLTYLYYPNVTSTSITGTNQQLPTVVPYNRGTGTNKKYNVCKSGQQLQITGYTMPYWEIYISTLGGDACLGSDNRKGCFVA